MRTLRVQLLFSHLTLVFLLVAVMAGAVFTFARLGRSIDRILVDNYKSVIAAQNMKEALERQDSAATFFLAGQVEKARKQFEANWPRFQEAYQVEANNITESGEQEISDDIGQKFAVYRREVSRLLYAAPPIPPAQANALYFRTLEPAFAQLKRRAQDVLDLNQEAIVRADEQAKQEAQQATVGAVGTSLIAFLLAVVFALGMIRASLTPLQSLARQAEEIGAGHLNQRIELHRSDEIGTLAQAFNRMAERLREARRLEEERLHRAERMSDAALDSLYDPVVVTDAGGRVVHLNRAAEGLFGPVERAYSRPVRQAIPEPRLVQAIEQVITQQRVAAHEDESGILTLAVGEHQRTYRLRATPMREETSEATLLGAVAVLEDVTHLREVDRLKTEFVSVASHELRTPVQSLLLSVQLMEEGAVGELTPDQREIVQAQREDLERLQRMMQDLLDITRLEAGALPPRLERVAPEELAKAALSAVTSTAEARGVELQSDFEPGMLPVRADRGQMTRVLVNLLNNAIRHTPGGGRVSLEVSGQAERVCFQVKDTGSGIPQEYLERIFERFVQVPGATRGGSGLGLSIARTMVRAHGGDITAQSEVGHGSTFMVLLPASSSAQQIGSESTGK